MALTGKQKAALLLTTLDAGTAADLLKGVDAGTVQELAVELSYLDAAGYRNAKQAADVARLFCKSLRDESTFHFKSFLREMLRNTVGEEQARRIGHEIQDLLQKRDPFIAVRSAEPETLATILESEHPQAVAVILSELTPRKSSAVLERLPDGLRISAVSRMTSISSMTPEAKARIAQMVRQRIEATPSDDGTGTAMQARPQDSLRKVAVIVRSLGKEVREGVLNAIEQKDKQAAEKVMDLMVIWEDLPQIDDRSLQEVLRCTNERELALALSDAGDEIAAKVKDNISERTAAMVEEESSLMSSPRREEIQKAKDKIVAVLRERIKMDKLNFVEE